MTYFDGKMEIFGMLNAVLRANIPALIPAIDMRWPGMTKPGEPPPTNGYYGRVVLNTTSDMQVSLAKMNGVSRYEWRGILLAQVFSPISVPGSLENGNLFAEAISDAFCKPSTSGLITFTNSYVREVGNTDTHYITNVSVTCAFDAFK